MFWLALLAQQEAILLITAYNAVRRRSRVTWSALLFPKFSSWKQLYRNEDDGSFLHITWFSREVFEDLKNIWFEGEDNELRRGRHESLEHAGKLGLYSSGQTLEWNVPDGFKDYLWEYGIKKHWFMRAKIIKRLRSRPKSRIKWPSLEEMRRWVDLFEARKPDIKNVVGSVDCLTLAIQCSDEISEQNFWSRNPFIVIIATQIYLWLAGWRLETGDYLISNTAYCVGSNPGNFNMIGNLVPCAV